MEYQFRKKAILLLEDGSVFEGRSIGKDGTSGGEICFNTGMTGYQEIYTDPSYFGQIIVNTTSHIGNYGVINAETESSSVKIQGLVVKSFSDIFSRKTAEGSLQDYLEKAGVVGISDVDTRKIVRHIREEGAMNAIISSEITDIEQLKAKLADVPKMGGLELSTKVTTKEPYLLGADNTGLKVSVLDLGVKTNILNSLVERNCQLKVFPAKTSFEEMQAWNPDGYFVSNGPGDPASTDYAVETVKKILEKDIPLFGICLGHQIIALACGITTYKMHHGHRGLNHPVKNLITGISEITSQNHGFCVSEESVSKSDNVEITHINLNDKTVEGIRVLGKKAFSVQHHPESSPGPHDSRYLFDQFVGMMTNAEEVNA
ncbi:glutamine-hydrolyzing carbamoyl-phosphate synthase small subunit [Flammeovirgaceae bacterium SG7u.111]|nr:glutamine-hydrolyzing carbamoyl-phosphate synthase small subunit [Flammeovirgaceae bacterium SG7u.132]WPO35874.1 glutamine-hydrolyzing carbamoyl-phosphate synthase small subunit [Flammeovirgaceae bacterium SG7u.111]